MSDCRSDDRRRLRQFFQKSRSVGGGYSRHSTFYTMNWEHFPFLNNFSQLEKTNNFRMSNALNTLLSSLSNSGRYFTTNPRIPIVLKILIEG